MACLVLGQRDTDAQRGSSRSPTAWGRIGTTQTVWCWPEPCSIWHLPGPARRGRRRPHPGSLPESASPPGNSRLPPLPGLRPATAHLPTRGVHPALPSKSFKPCALPGPALTRPQFPHVGRGWTGPSVPQAVTLQHPETTNQHADSTPSRELSSEPQCQLSPQGKVAPSQSLRFSPVRQRWHLS